MGYTIKLYDLCLYDKTEAIITIMDNLLYTELVARCILLDETEDEDPVGDIAVSSLHRRI